MKALALLLIILYTSPQSFAQNNSLNTKDSLGYSNVQETWERGVDNKFISGVNQSFDSTGALLSEGAYEFQDSIPCKNCYEGSSGFSGESGRWTKRDYTDQEFHIKVGVWKYYHPNGELKMTGAYSKMIRTYMGESSPIELANRPINVYIRPEELKDGIWKYFDETGKLYLIEEYIDGDLVYKEEKY